MADSKEISPLPDTAKLIEISEGVNPPTSVGNSLKISLRSRRRSLSCALSTLVLISVDLIAAPNGKGAAPLTIRSDVSSVKMGIFRVIFPQFNCNAFGNSMTNNKSVAVCTGNLWNYSQILMTGDGEIQRHDDACGHAASCMCSESSLFGRCACATDAGCRQASATASLQGWNGSVAPLLVEPSRSTRLGQANFIGRVWMRASS
jgi:hypothetical protein